MTVKKLNATAMSEVEVTHISLVKRGANRQPIKIHKSEDGNNTMSQKTLDLASIGSMAIKSDKTLAPILVAAIVAKGEGDRVSKLFAEVEGVDVVAVKADETNDCDVINFIEGDLSAGNTIVYKYDDSMTLLVSGVKESTQKMDFYTSTSSFKENVTKSSFFPNLREAGYALQDTVAHIMFDDDAGYAAKVEAEVAAHGEYVNALVKTLPVKVLKSMDAIDFAKPEEAAEEAKKTEAEEPKGEAAKGEEEAAAEAEEPKGEAAKEEAEPEAGAEVEAAAEAEEPKGEAAKEEAEPEAEKEPQADSTPAWAQQLLDSNTALNERLEAVEQNSAAAVQKAEEAKQNTGEAKTLAEKAEAALGTARSTVAADNLEEDLPVAPAKYSPELDDDLREGGIELA